MTDDLRCECGCRHLIPTTVLGNDGNPSAGYDWRPLWKCASTSCGRVYDLDTDGEAVKLKKVVFHDSVLAWRTL